MTHILIFTIMDQMESRSRSLKRIAALYIGAAILFLILGAYIAAIICLGAGVLSFALGWQVSAWFSGLGHVFGQQSMDENGIIIDGERS